MPIFGTVTERDFREKTKAQKHIQIDAMHCSGFFVENALDEKCARSLVLDFPRDSPMKVKNTAPKLENKPFISSSIANKNKLIIVTLIEGGVFLMAFWEQKLS